MSHWVMLSFLQGTCVGSCGESGECSEMDEGGDRGTGWEAAGQGLCWPCHKRGGRNRRKVERGSLSQQGQKGCAGCPGNVRRKMLHLREEKRELQEVGAHQRCCGCGRDASLGNARLSPNH